MTVSEAPDSERAIRHTRLEPSSSLPHPKLPPRSQHADNRTQCEVYRERDPETDSGYGFELGSRRLLIRVEIFFARTGGLQLPLAAGVLFLYLGTEFCTAGTDA